MMHEVFICYASSDKSVAAAVCDTLESRQIGCWIAPRDVLPGVQWAESIVDAIDSSRAIVLVLSANSNISPQVIREVGRAAGKGIPIIPLRIDEVIPSKSMDYFISSHHFLDVLTPPLEKHLKRLADTVQQILSQKGAPPKVVEEAEAEEKAKREAEEARKAKEAEEKAKREAKEAELAAKEREERKAKEKEKKKAAEVIPKVALCPKCGTELRPKAIFCHKCGARISQSEKTKEAEEEAKKKAAGVVPKVALCPKCGTELRPKAIFCHRCGTRISQSEKAK